MPILDQTILIWIQRPSKRCDHAHGLEAPPASIGTRALRMGPFDSASNSQGARSPTISTAAEGGLSRPALPGQARDALRDARLKDLGIPSLTNTVGGIPFSAATVPKPPVGWVGSKKTPLAQAGFGEVTRVGPQAQKHASQSCILAPGKTLPVISEIHCAVVSKCYVEELTDRGCRKHFSH
eukprot:s518_g8.t1